jgi:O-antigen/teichoic acid export membrane protein
MNRLYTLVHSHRALLLNAGSLIATTVVNSGLGFVYWWYTARFFAPAAVGLASAAIASMLLLGTLGVLGLGTLLMGELPRQPTRSGALLSTALLVAGSAGFLLGLGYAYLAPVFAPDLAVLASTPGIAVLFAAGVALTAGVIVLDQGLIGMLLGGVQLQRNILFAAGKLVLLVGGVVGLGIASGVGILATWIGGIALSLIVLVQALARQPALRKHWVPDARLLRQLRGSALAHHTLNLALQAPGLLLPVVVTALYSAALNASFYVAWMIVGLAFVAPLALTNVLYTVSAAQPARLPAFLRLSLGGSLLAGLCASGVLLISASWVLGLFGAEYAAEAAPCLRILVLGVFPATIKQHYVALARLHQRIGSILPLVIGGSVLELLLAVVGAWQGALTGLALGWIAALLLEAIVMWPAVYRAAQLDRFTLSGTGRNKTYDHADPS